MDSLIEKYYGIVSRILSDSFEKNGFGTLLSLLRVAGMHDANWDPYEEGIKGTKEFESLRAPAKKMYGSIGEQRIILLMYCQLIEMTAPHALLANCLRIIKGEDYHINPLGHLVRSKKQTFRWVPPSASQKYRYIKELARETKHEDLVGSIDDFFDDSIRNSFSHSDYIITDEYYRWTEGGPAMQMSLEELAHKTNACFSFYDALIAAHRNLLSEFRKLPRFHKWPNYEVLEILSNDTEVYGYNIHFSNGSKATYARTEKGVEVINHSWNSDGTINFFCGLIDALEPVWKIDGNPVDDFNKES